MAPPEAERTDWATIGPLFGVYKNVDKIASAAYHKPETLSLLRSRPRRPALGRPMKAMSSCPCQTHPDPVFWGVGSIRIDSPAEGFPMPSAGDGAQRGVRG